MAKSDLFRCRVITPEKVVVERDAAFVALPAHDGELGVLAHHAPLVCKLGTGPMRVESPSGNLSLLVDGGFAQVIGREVTVLTEQAKPSSAIDAGTAALALKQAQAMPITDDQSFQARARAIRRAQVELRLADSS